MHTPTVIVLGLLTMQPRLQAEESILESSRVAMGTGSLKAEDADATAKRWDAAANPDAEPSKPKPAAALMGHGIPVRRVKTGRKSKKKQD